MGFGNLGIWEILVIAVIILLFFGPRRLPEIARSMGGAMREFKRGLNELQREFELAEDADASKREREARKRESTGTLEPREAPSGAVSTEEAGAGAAEGAGAVATGDGGGTAGAAEEQGSQEVAPDPSQSDLFGTSRG